MGIFSDEEINEADRLISGELEEKVQAQSRAISEQERKRLRLEFLEGFEKGWKWAKNEYSTDPGTRSMITSGDLMRYLRTDTDKNIKDFAYGLGLLVGYFRHLPTVVIGITQVSWFEKYVNALKDKPEYYKFIVKRVRRWTKVIQTKYWSGLGEDDKRRYLKFIKSV